VALPGLVDPHRHARRQSGVHDRTPEHGGAPGSCRAVSAN